MSHKSRALGDKVHNFCIPPPLPWLANSQVWRTCPPGRPAPSSRDNAAVGVPFELPPPPPHAGTASGGKQAADISVLCCRRGERGSGSGPFPAALRCGPVPLHGVLGVPLRGWQAGVRANLI